jgi:hypothetical protein
MALKRIEPSRERLITPDFSVTVSPTAARTIGAAPATMEASKMVIFRESIKIV